VHRRLDPERPTFVIGLLLLGLLVVAIAAGVVAGGTRVAARVDTWSGRAGVALALAGAVGSVAIAAGSTDDLPVVLAFAAAPMVLTALVQQWPNVVATGMCALLLVAFVAVTGLSFGLLFAPAAVALVLLAALRLRRALSALFSPRR
jgi:hypothetical protein